MLKKFLAIMLVGVLSSSANAQSSSNSDNDPFYCLERDLGYYFYCEDEEPEEEEPEQPVPQSSNATQALSSLSEQLDELKAAAILNPTSENVARYIQFQREQLDRASTFADMWQRVLWQTPELDYTLQRPVNALAKRQWDNARTADRESVMRSLSERYGVFYFFSSGCDACAISGPIVKGISDRFGLTVMAVSVDGGPSQSFPDYLIDTGQFRAMGLAEGGQVPALVLFDTQTRQPMTIGFGVLAADEIMTRVYTLTQTEVGSDF